MSNKVTIYTIAAEADVSPATVSRFLTGKVSISNEKKLRIESAIHKFKFTPNTAAQRLVTKKTYTLGFILPDVSHPFYGTAFLEAEKTALQCGYTILLMNTLNDNLKNPKEIESKYFDIVQNQSIDGLVMMGGHIDDLYLEKNYQNRLIELSEQIPIVVINNDLVKMKCHRVIVREKPGIQALINYLCSLKHQKIAIIGGIDGIHPTAQRIQLLKDAFRMNSIEFHSEWCITGGFDIDFGEDAMEKIIQKSKQPTALVCLNDLVAIGAIKAANKSGIRCPNDMSITGIDNIYLTEYVTPEITTVDLSSKILGSLAVKALIDILNGSNVPEVSYVDAKLVVRNSCKRNSR